LLQHHENSYWNMPRTEATTTRKRYCTIVKQLMKHAKTKAATTGEHCSTIVKTANETCNTVAPSWK
jgi:hypothetical protein